MMPPSAQTEVAFVELIIIIAQVTHGNHALTMVLINLRIDAITGNSADMCGKRLAHFIGHKLYHLIFNRVAFGILCHQFHLRTMLTKLLIMLLIRAPSTLGIARKQAMNHRVGVSSNRTCEMRVIVECQTKVANIVHTVFRFHHGSERNRLNHLRFGFAFGLIHQLIQAASHRSFCAFGFHFVTKFHNKLAQGFHLLRVRIIVHTIGKRLCFPPFLALSDALGHGFVGQQHKLFNQLVGIVRPFKIATCGLSLFVYIEMQFFAVKLHCAMLKTFLAQRLG